MEIYFDKLNTIRKEQKKTIPELCSEIGISRSTYFRWQNGEKSFSKATIYLIANVLNVDSLSFSNISFESKEEVLNSDDTSPLDWINAKNEPFRDDETLKHIINKLSYFEKKHSSMKEFAEALLYTIDIPIYIKSINLKYIEANIAFKKIFSLKNNYNIIGKTDSDFLSKTEAANNTNQDISVIKTGKAIKDYEQTIPGTHKKRCCLCTKVPIYHNNKVTGILGLFFDITEKKQVDLLNEQLKINMDNMSSMITIFDINKKKLLYANKLAFDYINLPLETYYKLPLKERFKKLLPEEDYKQVNWSNSDLEILENFKEYKIIDKNGNIKFFEATTKLQSFNKIDSMVRIRRDITEKKNKEILQNIILKMTDSFGLGISIHEVNTQKVIYGNYSVISVLGFNKNDIQDKNDNFFFDKIKEPEDLKNVKAILKKGEGTVKFRMTDSNNQLKYIKLMCSKLIYNNKECMIRISSIISKDEFHYQLKVKNIAKRLKDKGMPTDVIAETTELPKEIIINL